MTKQDMLDAYFMGEMASLRLKSIHTNPFKDSKLRAMWKQGYYDQMGDTYENRRDSLVG